MTAEEFRSLASRYVDSEGIDSLCIVWLEYAAMEQAPKVRDRCLLQLTFCERGWLDPVSA